MVELIVGSSSVKADVR